MAAWSFYDGCEKTFGSCSTSGFKWEIQSSRKQSVQFLLLDSSFLAGICSCQYFLGFAENRKISNCASEKTFSINRWFIVFILKFLMNDGMRKVNCSWNGNFSSFSLHYSFDWKRQGIWKYWNNFLVLMIIRSIKQQANKILQWTLNFKALHFSQPLSCSLKYLQVSNIHLQVSSDTKHMC